MGSIELKRDHVQPSTVLKTKFLNFLRILNMNLINILYILELVIGDKICENYSEIKNHHKNNYQYDFEEFYKPESGTLDMDSRTLTQLM